MSRSNRIAHEGHPGGRSGERGNVLLLCLLLIAMLWAIAIAQVSLLQRHVRQSSFFSSRSELREYAESGIALAKHDLGYHLSANEGLIGTAGWSVADDFGADGLAGTGDEGEGDGLPTMGEPNTAPQAIGPAAENVRFLVYTQDTADPKVKRVTAEARDGEARVLLESHLRRALLTIPRTSPILVPPTVTLDLNGNAFAIDGTDKNLDGSLGSEPAKSGIATPEGETAGDNAAALAGQVDLGHYDQVLGAGGPPSIGEVPEVDTQEIFEYFKAIHGNAIPAGSYATESQGRFGDSATGDYRITYVPGDLELGGQLKGAGVLVVGGDLVMTGQSRWDGLVIATGHLTLTGGGAGVHVFGSLWALGATLTVEGTADIFYSSQAMDAVDNLIQNSRTYYAMMFLRER